MVVPFPGRGASRWEPDTAKKSRDQRSSHAGESSTVMPSFESGYLGFGRTAEDIFGDDPGINFIGEDEPLERGCSGDPFEEEDLYEAMGPSISEVAKARHDAAQQVNTKNTLPDMLPEDEADELLQEALESELSEASHTNDAEPAEVGSARGREGTRGGVFSRSGSPDFDELVATGEEEYARSQIARAVTRTRSPGSVSCETLARSEAEEVSAEKTRGSDTSIARSAELEFCLS